MGSRYHGGHVSNVCLLGAGAVGSVAAHRQMSCRQAFPEDVDCRTHCLQFRYRPSCIAGDAVLRSWRLCGQWVSISDGRRVAAGQSVTTGIDGVARYPVNGDRAADPANTFDTESLQVWR